MGTGFPIFEIVIFGMIAAFLILRLKNTLGRRTGHEQEEPRTRFGLARGGQEPHGDSRDDNVLTLPGRDRQPEEAVDIAADAELSPVDRGLKQIARADRGFDPRGFLEGARAAYEMIVVAFAKGDGKALKPLLAEKVYKSFQNAIDQRREAGHAQETSLVGFKSSDIVEAQLINRVAEVTVKFVSEMISVTRDGEGRVVAGDPDHVSTVTDIWTFARDTRSRDPNWELIATRSAH